MALSVKNNPLSSMLQLGGSMATQGPGKLGLGTAMQLLQTVTQLAGSLKQLQSSFGKDGFSSGGQGMMQNPLQSMMQNPLGALGGGKGQGNPIMQLGAMVAALMAAMQAMQGKQGQGGMPGMQGGMPGMPQSPMGGMGGMANTSMPLGETVQLINNLKQEQGALLGKISQGVKNGSITQKELGPLMQQVDQLAQNIKSAASKGHITMGEASQLQQGSLNNILATKSAVENNSRSMFAPFNPVAQNQAKQLASMGHGVAEGSIKSGELSQLAKGQGAIANASGRVDSLGDAARLLTSQKMLGLEVQMARLTHVGV